MGAELGSPVRGQYTINMVEQDLIYGYGEAFLRYVLVVDAPQDLHALDPTPAQREVLDVLLQLVSGAPRDPQGFGRYSHLSGLGQWQQETGSSVANALRVHCGGELPTVPEVTDDVVRNLLLIARDVWPSLLLAPPQGGPATFWGSVPVGVFNHPATSEAAKAFLADRQLQRLFPGASLSDNPDIAELAAVSAQWISTSGGGGSQQLIGFLGTLISNAHIDALARSGDDSWDGFASSLPQIIDWCRALASGRTVRVPHMIAFIGVAIPEGTEIELPHGKLFAPRTRGREFLLPESQNASAAFLTTFEMKLVDIRTFEPGDPSARVEPQPNVWDEVSKAFADAQRTLDLTRLAVLLSGNTEVAWGMSELASLILDPTAAGGRSRWPAQRLAVSHAEVDSEAATRIGRWWRMLDGQHPIELDIAMRRVLGAASSRIDPIDGFVDAVVAWENCFGTSTETTFRVTGAIAMLLPADSADARLERLRNLKSLYNKRSRIVHGALQPHPEEAVGLRDEALRIAVECLRQLHEHRPDLLPLKAEERSTRLLVGGAQDKGT